MIVIGHYDSGCFPQPAGLEVNLIGRLAAKRLVRPNAVVEAEISFQSGSRVSNGVVGLQIDFLVFHAAPQPLDEYVVEPVALAIHADTHTGVLRSRVSMPIWAMPIAPLSGCRKVWTVLTS